MSCADPERQEAGTASALTHVPEEQSISLAVVEAVAAVSGRPPLLDKSTVDGVDREPLAPLNDVIDPDALDALCRPRTRGTAPARTLTFTYCGYEVTVEGGERIRVAET